MPELKPVPPDDIAVSLSGGGHRATLFGLGVLLALVDRGLNRRVKQIASVSGGSITNGFIATRCKFDEMTTKTFDEVAAQLVYTIVNKGVLTRRIIVALLSGLLVPPLVFMWLAWLGTLSWLLAAPLVGVWLGMALLRGVLIEWIIEVRFFPPNFEVELFPPKLKILRKCLGDLPDRPLEHAICCTDHENTVGPRMEIMRHRQFRRMFLGERIDEPRVDALAETLGLSKEQSDTFVELNEHGYLAATGPWDIPLRLAESPSWPLGMYLESVMNVPSSEPEYGAVRDTRLRNAELFKLANIDVSQIGTHLDRIGEEDAVGLLAIGYLSAFLWTVALKPLETEEIDCLENVPQRLRRMARSASANRSAALELKSNI